MRVGQFVWRVTSRQSLFAQLAEVVGIGQPIWRRELGVMLRVLLQLNVNAVRNNLRHRDRFFVTGKCGVHFLGRADIELIAVHPHPLLVIDGHVCAHTEQHIMSGGVFLIEIVRVVCRD